MPTEAERLVGYLIGRLLAVEKERDTTQRERDEARRERDLMAQRCQQLEAAQQGDPEPPEPPAPEPVKIGKRKKAA